MLVKVLVLEMIVSSIVVVDLAAFVLSVVVAFVALVLSAVVDDL